MGAGLGLLFAQMVAVQALDRLAAPGLPDCAHIYERGCRL